MGRTGLLKIIALAGILLAGFMSCGRADLPSFMEGYLWEKRVLIIFTPSKDNPNFSQQVRQIDMMKLDEVKDRKLEIIYLIDRESVLINGAYVPRLYTPPFYAHYNIKRSEFAAILIGKDGEEKYRAHAPISKGELIRMIDSMPMRQQEIKAQDKAKSKINAGKASDEGMDESMGSK